MEKIVNHKEKVDGFLEKGLPFVQNRSTFFDKRVYLFFFGLVLYENATNAVSHRMHGIRFSTVKRLVRKRFVS